MSGASGSRPGRLMSATATGPTTSPAMPMKPTSSVTVGSTAPATRSPPLVHGREGWPAHPPADESVEQGEGRSEGRGEVGRSLPAGDAEGAQGDPARPDATDRGEQAPEDKPVTAQQQRGGAGRGAGEEQRPPQGHGRGDLRDAVGGAGEPARARQQPDETRPGVGRDEDDQQPAEHLTQPPCGGAFVDAEDRGPAAHSDADHETGSAVDTAAPAASVRLTVSVVELVAVIATRRPATVGVAEKLRGASGKPCVMVPPSATLEVPDVVLAAGSRA